MGIWCSVVFFLFIYKNTCSSFLLFCEALKLVYQIWPNFNYHLAKWGISERSNFIQYFLHFLFWSNWVKSRIYRFDSTCSIFDNLWITVHVQFSTSKWIWKKFRTFDYIQHLYVKIGKKSKEKNIQLRLNCGSIIIDGCLENTLWKNKKFTLTN